MYNHCKQSSRRLVFYISYFTFSHLLILVIICNTLNIQYNKYSVTCQMGFEKVHSLINILNIFLFSFLSSI